MVNLIIAGSRNFSDYKLLSRVVSEFIKNVKGEKVTIISGGAKGADFLGEKYARENGIELEVKKADWNKHGKSAGPIRNSEMAKIGTHLIAFWDGSKKGSGTYNMICQARKNGLQVLEIKYDTVQSEMF